MGDTFIASNANSAANKWVPYYWKTFALGRMGDGSGSTDGNTYITQEVGTSAVAMKGFCTSSHNCGYYYKLVFSGSGGDYFQVNKYDLNDNLIETILASSGTGPGRSWQKTSSTITIDIGVIVDIASSSAYDASDVYKITLPSSDTMDRRKIYHGGYSTFMRMPYTEGVAYHSDIIPCNLDNKNVTVLWNAPFPINHGGSDIEMCPAKSTENLGTNLATSCLLEWNGNPKGVHSNASVAALQAAIRDAVKGDKESPFGSVGTTPVLAKQVGPLKWSSIRLKPETKKIGPYRPPTPSYKARYA